MSAFSWTGLYINIYISFKYPLWWQKLLGSARSGSTALSYRNCVITLVSGWWGQGIARAFTRCMRKNIYNASVRAVCDTRPIFKWSLTSLNSEFSFLGCPRGVMFIALDCGIAVSVFELQSHYYVHFRTNTPGKGMNPLIPLSMGQMLSLLFFWEDDFSIK